MKITTTKSNCILYAFLIASLLVSYFDGLAEARVGAASGVETSEEHGEINIPRRLKMDKSMKPKKKKKKKYDDEDTEDETTETPPDVGGATGRNDSKPTIGLALQGGGFPAGILSGALLRGFQRSKIMIDGEERPAMEGFDITAGMSGANIAQILYAYAPGTTADELLDVDGIGHPSEITKEELAKVADKSFFSLFSKSVVSDVVYALIIAAIFPQEDMWENLVYKRFLEPFGIARHQAIGKTRDDVKATPFVMTSVVGPAEHYPDYLIESRAGSAAMNHKFGSNLAASPHIFTALDEFLIQYKEYYATINHGNSSDVLWEIAKQSLFQIPYAAYISPDEFTIPMQEHSATFDVIANITVDPIDFLPISKHPDNVMPEEMNQAFTLAKMFAAGTNFLTMRPQLLDAFPLAAKPNYIEIPTATGEKRKLALSDGGYNVISGVPTLIKKGVKKIICSIYALDDWIQFGAEGWLLGQLTTYFGVVSAFTTLGYMQNHVFDLNSNNENQIIKFFDIITSLHNAGEPMIATLKDLDIVDNKFWGIQGGGKVDLTIIVNIGVPQKFADQVPLEAVPPPEGMNVTDSTGYGYFTNPAVQYVPNLPMFSGLSQEVTIPILNLTLDVPVPNVASSVEEVKMMEVLGTWTIEHAWDGLVGDDGEMKFEGFKKIFEDL